MQKQRSKPLSGWERRKRRVAAGLPPYTAKEADSRARRDRERAIARKEANRLFLAELKVARGCVDCGYNAASEALDFDHLPGVEKLGGLARISARATRQALLAEIAKCEVVCANCHRIRTRARGPSRRSSTAEFEQVKLPL